MRNSGTQRTGIGLSVEATMRRMTMRETAARVGRAFDPMSWAPSVYYANSLVNCPLPKVWELLLDYEAWNPSFADALVTRVAGEPRTEGEIVLIKKSVLDAIGQPIPEFYAETVKLIVPRRIVWYVYPREGDSFRNFVDFGLTEVATGVRFNIDYYAQNPLVGELLSKERVHSETGLHDLALAFKRYCESRV
jgi:hypothetical protein